VDEPAQYIVTLDVERWGSDNGGHGARHRHAKVKLKGTKMPIVSLDSGLGRPLATKASGSLAEPEV
jgi:hypothetical protein